ncbi:hypothetical protein L210DRAFT_873770, partial [Boletus edulis BED1]
FICNHYQEAAESICVLTSELTALRDTLKLRDDDFPCFIAEERKYLLSLKQLPAQDVLKVRYVQVLDDVESRR